MNSWRILQKICPFILLVLQGVHSGNAEEFKKCDRSPSSLPSVKATVYLNGENTNSNFYTLTSMCLKIFSMGVLSIIFKIGATVNCDTNDICSCKGSQLQPTDCKDTFKTACVSTLVDPSTLFTILCCQNDTSKTLDRCINEVNVNMTDLQNCIDSKTGQKIAIGNSKEMAVYLPASSEVSEPYILFGNPPIYDECMSKTATHYFSKTVCAMLDPKVAAKSPCT